MLAGGAGAFGPFGMMNRRLILAELLFADVLFEAEFLPYRASRRLFSPDK